MHPSFAERLAVLETVASTRPWLGVAVTDRQLIVEVASGYDALVMGTDKWQQVTDPAWYSGSAEARDQAVAMLPRVLIAPRTGSRPPMGLPPGSLVLDIDEDLAAVSSTLVKGGRVQWMLPEAAGSGFWSATNVSPD